MEINEKYWVSFPHQGFFFDKGCLLSTTVTVFHLIEDAIDGKKSIVIECWIRQPACRLKRRQKNGIAAIFASQKIDNKYDITIALIYRWRFVDNSHCWWTIFKSLRIRSTLIALTLIKIYLSIYCYEFYLSIKFKHMATNTVHMRK